MDWQWKDLCERCPIDTPHLKAAGLPVRFGIVREGVHHDIIAMRDSKGYIGVKSEYDDKAKGPFSLTPQRSGPMSDAGLKKGDILYEITIPVLASKFFDSGLSGGSSVADHAGPISDCLLAEFPLGTVCHTALFRPSKK